MIHMLNLSSISINIVPKMVFLVFLLLSITFFLNIKIILKQFKEVRKRTWLLLILILILGTYLRFFIAPYHFRVFIDEPEHVETAKNILQFGEAKSCQYMMKENCTVYSRQLGWPLLLSLWFFFFGVNNYVAINLSVLLGSISVILMFLVGYLLFKKESIALWASLLLCLTPIHVTWSGTASPNAPSLFFVLLTLLFFTFYFKERSLKSHFLAVFSLLFTLYMRSEFLLLLPIIFVLYAFYWGKLRIQWSPWIVFAVFLPIYFIQASLDMAANLGIYGGFFFNLFNLLAKLLATLGIVSNNYNILFIISLSLGLFLLSKKKRTFTPLLILFLAFFLMYASFEKQQARMFLVPNSALILFSAYGLDFLARKFNKAKLLLIALVIISFVPSLAGIEMERYGALETKIPQLAQEDIPENCYIMLEWTHTLASTDFKLVDSFILGNKDGYIDYLYNKTDCVLFYEDMYCKAYNSQKCKQVFEKFNLTEYKSYSDFGETYTFYSVSKKT